MRNLRLAAARRISEIPEPAVLEYGWWQLEATYTTSLEFGEIAVPQVNGLPLVLEPPIAEVQMLDTDVDVVELPWALIPVELDDQVETIDLLEPLTSPSVGGTRYKNDGEAIDDPVEKAAKSISLPRQASSRNTAKCKHGLVKSTCQICRDQSSRPTVTIKEPGKRAINVFEILKHVLQPPIFSKGGNFVIFPDGRKPFDFQQQGIIWLANNKEALLADQMGLGKTVQAIVAMRALFRKGEAKRALVVCPVSVLIHWEREFRAWAPELSTVRLTGTGPERGHAWQGRYDVFIVSHETLRNDINEMGSRRFEICIVDEAQKIKNRTAKISQAVRRIEAEYRWALTGTPLENRAADTSAIFAFIKPGFLPADRDLETRYLRKKITPYVLRRTTKDVDLDLPDYHEIPHWLELSPVQRAEYDLLESTGVKKIQGMGEQATVSHVLTLIKDLKLICNHSSAGNSSKLEFLKERLDEIVENDEKALVFSQYPNLTLSKIKPALVKYRPQMFTGSMSAVERTRVLDEFQNDAVHDVLLLSLMAGGTGITLTRANHVFHFDHWWNPAKMEQASKRAHRIGQHKTVYVHSLFSENTIEERIEQKLRAKKALFAEVFDGISDEQVSASLNEEEIFGLFGLTPPPKKKAKASADSSPVVTVNARSPQEASPVQRVHVGITEGEGERREFKSTLRLNLHTNKNDRAITHACIKTVAAFLNSKGGELVIGVADDGSLVGIDQDGFENGDKFELHLWDGLKNALGGSVALHVSLEVIKVGGQSVCLIDCDQSTQPVFCKQKGGEETFYIRTGPSTTALPPREMLTYIENHFDTTSSS